RENIDDLLFKDNAAIPSLEAGITGNLNKQVYMEESSLKDFSDTEVVKRGFVVGKALNIDGADFDKGTLTFTLDKDVEIPYYMTEEGKEYPALLVGKYDEAKRDADYLPITYTTGDEFTLSADIDGRGTYFVLHVENLLKGVGLDWEETPEEPVLLGAAPEAAEIYLNGPVPVPVTVTTDEFTISEDYDRDGVDSDDELGDQIVSLDLDALMALVTGEDSTETVFGTIWMYLYDSNPVLQDSDFDGKADDADGNSHNNVFKGKLTGYLPVNNAEYTFDYLQFFQPLERYNEKIASASLVMANTIYVDSGFIYSDGTTYKDSAEIEEIEDLMEFHGFSDVIDYKLKDGYTSEKINMARYTDDDISEIGIGHHTVTYQNETKTILAVVIRGTNGTIEEWSSNFDMGDGKAGDDAVLHKGFHRTEQRIRDFVDQYTAAYGLNGAEGLTYWITGHSRGAALSNLLAADLAEDGKKVVAYTFATPATTTASKAEREGKTYDGIFNFANTCDFVTYVPLTEWDFGHYGTTYYMDIAEKQLQAEWKAQTVGEILNAEDAEKEKEREYNALKQSIIKLATSRIAGSGCATRGQLYDHIDDQWISEEEKGYISDRAMKFCVIEENTHWYELDKYTLWTSYGFLFQMGAEVLAGSDEEVANVMSLMPEFWNSEYSGVLLLLLGDVIWEDFWFLPKATLNDTLVGDGHAMATYYVLLDHYDF
ncbi:MAG: hypothetical protein Q4C06_00505, partial [Bacillota bacterium]|nr:hypothetical protein [Bacillota bacterium]